MKLKDITLDKFIIAIAIISLFFTFTNYIPVSAIVSLMIIFLPYYMYKQRNELSKVTKWLFILFSVMALLALIYDMKSLLKYEFYRRDGNLFITYAPLLILPLIKNDIDMNKLLEKFLSIMAIINIVLIIQYLTQNSIQEILKNERVAFFMFQTHNAAGGYISTLLCLSIGVFVTNKNTKNFAVIVVNTIALLLTNSRGSIIGVIFALLVLICNTKALHKFQKILKNIDIKLFVLCLTTIIMVSSIIMANLGNKVLIEPKDEFELPKELTQYEWIFKTIGRSHTIINRTCYLWPRAMRLFTESPLLGTGFGSYTDRPYELLKIIPNILEINVSEVKYSDSHAHNSYLHVLSETGILGFSILMVTLFYIRKSILNIENKTYKCALYSTFICIVFSSFTEHRLFTPSQLLPFTIILGLCLSWEETKKKNNKIMITGEKNENINSK